MKPADGVIPLNEVKVITATPDQIINEVSEVAEMFRDTFGI